MSILRGAGFTFTAVLFIFLPFCSEELETNILMNRFSYVKISTGILRSDPMPMAPELDQLPYGTRLQVIQKSREPMRIGSAKEHWYLVQKDSKIEGWIYGTALTFSASDIDPDRGPAKKNSVSLKEENLLGKWWEIHDDGSIGLGKIYFYKDGIYRHGYGQSEMFEGKYEISGGFVLLDRSSSGGDRLEGFFAGDELRLKGAKKSIPYVFIRGDEDPGSLEEEEKQEEKPDVADSEAKDS